MTAAVPRPTSGFGQSLTKEKGAATGWLSRLLADSDSQDRQSSVVASYLVPSLIVILVTLSWFQPGAQIGNGDVSPLIRRGVQAEIGSLWNHQVTGAGGTSLAAAASIDAWFVRLFGSPETGQRALFAGALVLTVLGSVHAVRRVTASPFVAGVVGLLAVFNPFLLLYLPNLIFPMAIGALGLLVGEMGRQAKDRTSSPLTLALLTLPVAYLSTNPPLLVMILGSVLVTLVAVTIVYGLESGRATLRLCLGAAPLAVLIHLWWIVPFLQVYLGGAVGTEFAAVTDTDNWAWVFAKNSLDRVVTLTAHWGWDERSFFPWVPVVESRVWTILRWSLPLGALAGLGVTLRSSTHQRRGAYVLGTTTLVLIIISQGVHAPFAPLNQFLFDSVPGWWLFREPVNKFGPALTLVYLMLFARFLEAVLHSLWRMQSISGAAGMSTAIGFAGTALLFPLPLITGEVIPDNRPGLPSAHVTVPSEWDEIGDLVSASPVEGKVLVLPLNQYYQVTTSWGYHGVDLAPQFFDRPVLQMLPGGYFGELPGYEALLRTVETSLLEGDLASASAAAESLGASHVVVRRDVVPGPLNLQYGDTAVLAGHASDLAGAAVIHDDSVALVVELRDSGGIFRLTESVLSSKQDLAQAVSDTGAAMVSHLRDLPAGPQPVSGLTWAANSSREEFEVSLTEPGLHRLEVSSRSAFFVQVTKEFDRPQPLLEFEPTLEVSVDGELVDLGLVATLPIGRDGFDQLLVDGLPVSTSTPFPVRSGSVLETRQMISFGQLGPAQPAGDCNNVEGLTLDQTGISSIVENNSLLLSAGQHRGCVVFEVPALSQPGEIRIPFEVRRGQGASVCLWQESSKTCLEADYSAANSGDLIVRQPAGLGGLELYLYADASTSPATVLYGPATQWKSLSVASTQVVEVFGSVTKLTAGQHVLSSDHLISRSVLEPFGQLGDCNNTDARSWEQVGLLSTRTDELIHLEASAHTACIVASVAADVSGPLTLSFEHRTLSGRPARYCLWVEGPSVCAESGILPASSGWESVALTATIPEGATSTDLYLYADGPDDGSTTTVVEFRSVDVALANPERMVLMPLGTETTDSNVDTDSAAPAANTQTPQVTANQTAPGQWHIMITGVGQPALLVAAESFTEGWELNGLPQGWTADPVMVDGWAQGWWLHGSGDAELELVYGPGRLTSIANKSSGIGVVGILVLWVVARKRRTQSLLQV